jgi:SMC interacting uncharacterized protein involved in chromosome segregation
LLTLLILLAPNSSILEQVSKDFLYESNKEKITASFDDSRINIYAQKSTVPVILSHLDEIVKSLRHQKISTNHVEENDLDEQLLKELEQITKTHIKYNKGDKVCFEFTCLIPLFAELMIKKNRSLKSHGLKVTLHLHRPKATKI